MPNLGLPELLVILVIVVLVFGAGKIPQLGKGLGEGIKNFKDAMREGQSGDSNKERSGSSSSNASRTRATSLVPSRECPPMSAKKSAVTLTSSTPRTSAQMGTRAASNSVRGATCSPDAMPGS